MNTDRRYANLPACNGQPAVCRFLATEGRSALLGYYRKRAAWDLAEDLAHDAFIKAWSGCESLEDASRVRPWLFGIARNHLADHYRRAQAERNRIEQLSPVSQDTDLSPADGFRDEMTAMLRENLWQLPDEQKPVIAAMLDGERQVDIARRLRVPLSTVKARAQRARRSILERANDQCDLVRDSFGRVIDCTPKTASCCA